MNFTSPLPVQHPDHTLESDSACRLREPSTADLNLVCFCRTLDAHIASHPRAQYKTLLRFSRASLLRFFHILDGRSVSRHRVLCTMTLGQYQPCHSLDADNVSLRHVTGNEAAHHVLHFYHTQVLTASASPVSHAELLWAN
jgi:hypothetical protein